jgi:hypothetical protein
MLKAAPLTPATGYRYVSGVQIHEMPSPSEAPPPSVTVTVEVSEPVPAHVDSLVETIERLCRAGMGGSPWPVIDLFPLMRPVHWQAYAREAGVPHPDQATRRAVRAAYRAKHGYEGPEVKDDVEDEPA